MKTAPREEPRDEFNADANLYVSGLPESAHEDYLRDLFAPYGLVQKDENHSRSRGPGAERIRLCAEDGWIHARAKRHRVAQRTALAERVPTAHGSHRGTIRKRSTVISARDDEPRRFPGASRLRLRAADADDDGSEHGCVLRRPPSYAAPHDFPYAGAPTVELGNPDEAAAAASRRRGSAAAAARRRTRRRRRRRSRRLLHRRPRLDHRRQTSQPFCIRRLSERPFVFPRTFHLRRRASDDADADADP